MALSEAKRRANDKWNKKQDEVKLRMPKGQKDILRQHATSRGESVNAFVMRAIRETMARDAERMDPE